MMSDRISVILVNYNGIDYNDNCIRSILQSTVADRIQVVVVDNASIDGSIEMLKDNWGNEPAVSVIELDDNYGFSRANNEGIKWSIGNGINRFFLLNNDTEIEPDTIEKMVALQQEKGAIVVPKTKYFDNRDTIWCAGGSFSKIVKKVKHRGYNKKDSAKYDNSGQTEFANGCAMLLNKDIIDKIGYLDERFFLYYEDTEYSLRAAQNNIPIWYCADAVVYHKVNGSTKGISKPVNDYYISRNWLLCNSLYLTGIRNVLFKIYFYINRIMWSALCLIKGNKDNANAVRRGIKDHKQKKYGKY